MQDYNDNQNRNRQSAGRQNVNRRNADGQSVNRQNPNRQNPNRQPYEKSVRASQANGAPRQPQRAEGQRPSGQRQPQRAGEQRPSGQRQPQRAEGQRTSGQRQPQRASSQVRTNKRQAKTITPQQAAKRKRKKIILFVAEIFVLLILVGTLWVVNKSNKMLLVDIDESDVGINKEIIKEKEEGTSKLQGYRNIALFGVDSRDKQLDKSTRTDTIMIASINLDTKEVKLVSILRDTWLNMSTDSYNKANAAYAKGGPKQAVSMLNMNLDMDITDFVTVGFDGLIDAIDAVGGIEIDVKESEIKHLNNYQISMVGRETGTLNDAGEPNYEADEGVEYTAVKHAGLQTLNGLQATAYARIRYVGNDFERTSRQRTVLTKVAKKAMTLNPAKLNAIAEAVFPEVATSLELSEILSLLSGIASYEIGENSSFPFDGYVQTGRVGKASVVIPVDLNKNVSLLHEFLFDDKGYNPTDTVKKCSQKISSDTGVSYSGE